MSVERCCNCDKEIDTDLVEGVYCDNCDNFSCQDCCENFCCPICDESVE